MDKRSSEDSLQPKRPTAGHALVSYRIKKGPQLGLGERSLLEHALVSYSIVWHLKEEMEHSDWKR